MRLLSNLFGQKLNLDEGPAEGRSHLDYRGPQRWPSRCSWVTYGFIYLQEGGPWTCLSHLLWKHQPPPGARGHPTSPHVRQTLTGLPHRALFRNNNFVSQAGILCPWNVSYTPVCPTTPSSLLHRECSINTYLSTAERQKYLLPNEPNPQCFHQNFPMEQCWGRYTYSMKSWSFKMEIFLFSCLSVDGRYLTSISALKKKNQTEI